MEYLIFKDDGGEPKVTGVRDGSAQSWFDDDFWLRNPHIKQFMWPKNPSDQRFSMGVPPEFDLDFIGLPMHKNAKHTDLIYLTPLLNGLVISSKFRSLLERFRLPGHRFYPVSFNQRDKKTGETHQIKDYWYLFFEKETGEMTINFSASTFDFSFHAQYLKLAEQNFPVQSYEDYMRIFFDTGTALSATKLVFNRDFNKELDLWGCKFLSTKNYISNRLLAALVESKITGYRTIDLERAKQIAKLTGVPSCELVFEIE
ncbi:hypothetical protein [Dyadobacter chenhuakuii]|uniref:Immunity protein 43 of polymorphic toxin system n=1 Tax=Dyadobacter chenhuakuii TaxID=2909339 RepID=A0ABY5E925_9BACT|nr:hypothetical protein [Dyadobacter chenhuakuii]UTM21806.1 hypothetical protein NFI80_25365 [Dyadobacter chenhuakuii]